jgi:hypothetical protein
MVMMMMSDDARCTVVPSPLLAAGCCGRLPAAVERVAKQQETEETGDVPQPS